MMITMDGETIKMKEEKEHILGNLLNGRALTLTELLNLTKINRNSLEKSITQLEEEEFLCEEDTGRHLYYKIPPERMVSLRELKDTPEDCYDDSQLPPFEYCRSCYGHLAGVVGVKINEKMEALGFFELRNENNRYYYLLTPKGREFFTGIGISPSDLKGTGQKFAKACLDWSQRKHHLGGSLGRAFLNKAFENGWMERLGTSRTLNLTHKGKKFFNESLALDF